MPDNRDRIDLTARQVEALRMLQQEVATAQSRYAAYMSAILHGYDVAPDAGYAFDGHALIRQ